MIDEELRSDIRHILWGAAVVILDLRVAGFDILVDVFGAFLIAWGVFDIAQRYPSPLLQVRLMLVCAAITAIGAVSDLLGSSPVEITRGEFSVWAAIVSTAQVIGSYARAAVLARNLADHERLGPVWSAAERALLVWAVPFVVVIDVLALSGSATAVFLLFAIPILYGLVRHLIALVQTVTAPA